MEEGAKVWLVDMNEDALKKTVEELGGKNVKFTAADVTKSEDVQRYVNDAVKAFDKIDVFNNNAGIEGVVKPIYGGPNVSTFTASKRAVVGLMRNLTLVVTSRKIRVNTVTPAPVDNNMMLSL